MTSQRPRARTTRENGQGKGKEPKLPPKGQYCKQFLEKGTCERDGCKYVHLNQAEVDRQKALHEAAAAKAKAKPKGKA